MRSLWFPNDPHVHDFACHGTSVSWKRKLPICEPRNPWQAQLLHCFFPFLIYSVLVFGPLMFLRLRRQCCYRPFLPPQIPVDPGRRLFVCEWSIIHSPVVLGLSFDFLCVRMGSFLYPFVLPAQFRKQCITFSLFMFAILFYLDSSLRLFQKLKFRFTFKTLVRWVNGTPAALFKPFITLSLHSFPTQKD